MRSSFSSLLVAEEESHILLFELKSVLNTGNTQSEKAVKNLEVI
jgi:hypothetical protein